MDLTQYEINITQIQEKQYFDPNERNRDIDNAVSQLNLLENPMNRSEVNTLRVQLDMMRN